MRLFRKKEEVLDPYTVEQCNNCSKTSKRKFTQGDYIFKVTDKCPFCGNGQMVIDKIFGDVVK